MKTVQKTINRVLIALLVLASSLVPLSSVPIASAAGEPATIYVSPNSAGLTTGQTFNVQVYLEQGPFVQAFYYNSKIQFSPNTLTVNSAMYSSSFSNQSTPPNINRQNGVVTLEAYNYSSNTASTILLATINVTAKAAGAASAVVNSAMIYSYGSYSVFEAGKRNGSYTVSNPAPAPAPAPQPTPSAPAAPQPGRTTSPTAQRQPTVSRSPATTTPQVAVAAPPPAGTVVSELPSNNVNQEGIDSSKDEWDLIIDKGLKPVITDVNVENITESSATISWDTSPFTDARIKYGYAPDRLDQEVTVTELVTALSVDLKDLESGKQVFYEIQVGNGEEVATHAGDFYTTSTGNGGLIVGAIIVGLLAIGGGLAFLFMYRRKHAVSQSALPEVAVGTPSLPIAAAMSRAAPRVVHKSPLGYVAVASSLQRSQPMQPVQAQAQNVPAPQSPPIQPQPQVQVEQVRGVEAGGMVRVARKKHGEDDIPDMFDVGKDRLQQVESRLHHQ